VQLETAINWLDFEVNRSKVKVATRPDVVKSQFVNTKSYQSFVGIFTNFHNFNAVGDKDELIKFEVERSKDGKVKSQGHIETKCTFPAET